MHPMCAGAHSTGVRLLIATALIGNIHDALNRVASGSTQQAVEEPKAPAVPIKKSVQPDYIVCLDDRKRFKSLKRHLRTVYNLTPEQYRAVLSGLAPLPLADGGLVGYRAASHGGVDADAVLGMWIRSRDGAARAHRPGLSPVPLPRMRQAVQRAFRHSPE